MVSLKVFVMFMMFSYVQMKTTDLKFNLQRGTNFIHQQTDYDEDYEDFKDDAADDTVPDPPTNLKANSNGPYEVLLTWDYEGTEEVLSYTIIGRVNSVERYNITTDNSTRCDLLSLDSCLNYTFEVFGLNTFGRGESANVSETTKTEVSPPVQTLNITNITSDSLTISWDPPATACPIILYNMNWTSEMLWGDSSTNSSGLFEIDPMLDEYDFGDLTPFTNYTICIYPMTETEGTMETCVDTTTDPDAPSELPYFSIIAQNHLCISVSWSKPREVNGIFEGYLLSWISKDGKKSGSKKLTDIETTDYLIEGTKGNTEYIVTLIVMSNGGETMSSLSTKTSKDPTTPVTLGLTMPILILCLAAAVFWFVQKRKGSTSG